MIILFVVTRVRASRSRNAKGTVQKALTKRSEQLLVTGYSNLEDAAESLSQQLGIPTNEAQARLGSLPAVVVEQFNAQSNFELLVALDAAGVECMVTDRPSSTVRAVVSPTRPRPPVTTRPELEIAPTPTKPNADKWQSAHEVEPATDFPATPPPQPPPASPPSPPEPAPDLSTPPPLSEQAQHSDPVWATQDLETLPEDVTQALDGSDHRVTERLLRRASLNGQKQADTALGIALATWGRFHDAEAAFRARLYDDPVAANNLGCLAYQAQNYAEAKRYFERAASLGSAEADLNLELEGPN